MFLKKNQLLVILGPTATGKTDLALSLAKKFNGELVSCDSRQVYKGLDIGTGKMPSHMAKVKRIKNYWEIEGIKVWMYDVVTPKKQYTVANYIQDAGWVIRDIRQRDKLPIVVGGTGFYLKALLEELSNLSIPIDYRLRARFEKLTTLQLQEELQKLSPSRWESMNYSDRQNPRRLIRSIELTSMYPYRSKTQISKLKTQNYRILKIGLSASREALYKRVDDRVISRIKDGMVDEVRRLYRNGLSLKRMRQLGLEYGVLADYLAGKIRTREDLIKTIQGKIHGYVRHQLTWFKKEKDVVWFDITDKNFPQNVEKIVGRWYHHPDAAKN